MQYLVDFDDVLDQVIDSQLIVSEENYVTIEDSFGSWFEAD